MFVLNFLKLTPFLKTIHKKIYMHTFWFIPAVCYAYYSYTEPFTGWINKDTALGVCLYVKILWPSSWLLNERIYILRTFSFMTHICTNENYLNKIKNSYKTFKTLKQSDVILQESKQCNMTSNIHFFFFCSIQYLTRKTCWVKVVT